MNNVCNRIQRQLAFDAYELLNLLEDIISGLNDVNAVRRAVHNYVHVHFVMDVFLRKLFNEKANKGRSSATAAVTTADATAAVVCLQLMWLV